MLETTDYTYLGKNFAGRTRGNDLVPSDLFARHVYAAVWLELLFGTDFATWPVGTATFAKRSKAASVTPPTLCTARSFGTTPRRSTESLPHAQPALGSDLRGDL
jgi:hypothetical protein